MSSRSTLHHLYRLHGDIDSTVEEMETAFDHTAIELLTSICANLSMAAAGVRNPDPERREQARQFASEYIQAMCEVLDVWELGDVEIVDGPGLRLEPPRPLPANAVGRGAVS